MKPRAIVDAVFTKAIADQIWTANTYTVFPVTPQDFSVGAVLPAVFYMFRWGHRRGKGRFRQTFGINSAKPTIFYVAGKLTDGNPEFASFDTEIKKNILGDLLLCYALENKGHKEGQQVEVQRVFPTHYLSSWIDLPYHVGDLRFVPEMLVALLAEQKEGRVLQRSAATVPFSVDRGLEENQLLKIFSKGVSIAEQPANLRGDKVDETADLAIDQLLTIRLAQMCGEAPEEMRGALANVPNSWSIAQVAASNFREDLAVFLRAYGQAIPRLTLVPMLESMIGLNFLKLFLSCTASVVRWERTGALIPQEEQRPWPLFVDASSGADHQLRRVSEESMERVNRLLDQAPTAMMSIRILDAHGRDDEMLQPHLPKGPDSTE